MRTRSLICAATLVAPLAALGQDDAIGAARLIFDTSTRVEANDNFGLDAEDGASGVIATQNVGLSFLSETRNQTLSFNLGAVYQLGEVPDTGIGTGWRDPSTALAYTRESLGSALSLSAQQDSRELGLGRVIPGIEDIEDGTLTPSDFVDDLGTLVRSSANIGLELGRTGPLSLTLGADYDRRDYQRTSDTELFDRTRRSVSSVLSMDLSPSLAASLSGDLELYTADDDPDTRRETRTIGARLDGRLDARRSVSMALSHARVTTDETLEGDRITDRKSGVSGEIGYEMDLPRGAFTATLASDFATTGRRNSLTFGRSLDLPRANLDLTAGVTTTDAGTKAIGSLRYALELPRGNLSAALERRARTTGDEDAIVQTVARLGHTYEINTLSSLNLSLDYARIDSVTDPSDDSDRTRIAATYSRALTRDWSLNIGVSHTRRTDDGANASANAMTVSLGRSFTRLW